MNKLEQKAVRSLLQLATEEDIISQRNWEPQSPKQHDFISPQPKSLNQHRKNIRMIPNHKARQKSSIEINQDDDLQLSQFSQKENSLQQLIEEYMKQIRHTQRQMESIHQSKFDLKSGWVNFNSIILENKEKAFKKYKRSSLEIQIKENNQQKLQQQQIPKKTPLRKVLNNDFFFLPKLKQSYLK